MPAFSIREARPWHCGQMARLLRAEHQVATYVVGLDAHRELRTVFDQSSFRRAWFIDGRLAALGGVTGTLMSGTGYVWLALSNEALRHPVAVTREALRQLDGLMRSKSELATTLIGGDAAAMRFAIFLGFHVGHEGPGSPAYSRFGRRMLSSYLERHPDLRIPVGAGYVIPMGYHHESRP